MEDDARIVKSILTVGALNAMATTRQIDFGSKDVEASLEEAVRVAARLYSLLFHKTGGSATW
jgi:hypothetical protein